MENKENFQMTYSAKEQSELRRIRDKYTEQNRSEEKMDRLRRLDASVTKTAQGVAISIGIAGSLVLGFGMSLCMTELGAIFGASKNTAMLAGIIVGVAGGIIASLAYPVYKTVVKSKRKRLAPEIIRLTDELMK